MIVLLFGLLQLLQFAKASDVSTPSLIKQYPLSGDYSNLQPVIEQDGVSVLSDGVICLLVKFGLGNTTSDFDLSITRSSVSSDTTFFAAGMQCAQIPSGGPWQVSLSFPTSPSLDISFSVTTVGDLSLSLTARSLSGPRVLSTDPFQFQWIFDSTTDPRYVCVLVAYGDIGALADTFGPPAICGKWSKSKQETQALHQSNSSALTRPLNHTYGKPGVFAIGIFAFNIVSNGSASLVVQVDDPPPCFPSIFLPENSSDIAEPLVRYRDRQIRFVVLKQLPIGCSQQQISTTKKWTLTRQHMMNRAVDDVLSPNGTQLYRGGDEIRFPSYSLPFGTYKLAFGMSLTPKGETRMVFTYFDLVPIPLMAVAYRKQSGLTLGRSQSVALRALELSTNPNEPTLGNRSALFDSFSWYCRPLDGGFNSSCPATNDSCSPSPKSCFSKGDSKSALTKSSLNVKGSDLIGLGKYEIGVIVRKNYTWDGGYGKAALNASSILELTVIEDQAWNVTIDCGLPQFCDWNGNGLVISEEVGLTLNATCWNCDQQQQTWSWTLTAVWANGTRSMVQNSGDDVTGTTTRFLSIAPTCFQAFADVDHIEAVVDLSTDTSSQNSAINIYYNDKPLLGTCSISPTNGIAVSTRFFVQCIDWSDPNEIEGYGFYYREAWTNDDWILLSYSILPWTMVAFPPGYYELLVVVEDRLGATASVRLDQTVNIVAPSLGDLDLSTMATSDGPILMASELNAFSLLTAEDNRWPSDQPMGLSLDDDQPSGVGIASLNEFLGLDIVNLMQALSVSNLSAISPYNGQPPPYPVVLTNETVAEEMAIGFLQSSYGLPDAAWNLTTASSDGKRLPISYDTFVSVLRTANISTDSIIATNLQHVSHLLKPIFAADIYGLVIMNQTAGIRLDQLIVVTVENVTSFVTDRIASLDGPTPASVGKLLVIDPSGPISIDLRYDTIAVRFVKLVDSESGASTILPVQISCFGAVSAIGKHTVATDGGNSTLLHKLPGASKWTSVRQIAEAIIGNVSLIYLPLNQHASDVAQALSRLPGVKLKEYEMNTVVTEILIGVQGFLDSQNDVIAKVYKTVLEPLSAAISLMEDSRQAAPILEAITKILDTSVKLSIDPIKRLLNPQTVINQEAMSTISQTIEIVRNLLEIDINRTTPSVAMEVSNRILRLITSVNKVLSRTSGRSTLYYRTTDAETHGIIQQVISTNAYSPLKSDRDLSTANDKEFFDTLSSDPRPDDEPGHRGVATVAQRRGQKIAKRIAETQLHGLVELVTVLLTRDKVAVENGININLTDAGTSFILASGRAPSILARSYAFFDGNLLQRADFPDDICQLQSRSSLAMDDNPSSCDANQTILLRLVYIPLDGLISDHDQVTSGTLDATIMNSPMGAPIVVSDSPNPIVMSFQPFTRGEDQKIQNVNEDLGSRDLMNVHKVGMPQSDGALVITFRLEDTLPAGANVGLFLKYGTFPGPYEEDYDNFLIVNETMKDELGLYKWSISSEDLNQYGGAGDYFLGVALISDFIVVNTTKDQGGWNFYSAITMPMYGLAVEAKYCFYYDVLLKNWLSDGCRVSSDTSSIVRCSCSHMSLFAAGLVALPIEPAPPVVLRKRSYSVNLSVYVTMIVLSCAYVLLSLWAKIRDRADAKMFSYYLTGEKGNSEVHDVHVTFVGDSCKFIFDCRSHLGQLIHFRLWQRAMDSDGPYYRLLIDKISIVDLRAGDQYAFEGERSVATNEENPDAQFPLVPIVRVVKFQHYPRLYALVSKILQEHLCLSIFARTQRSRMSRLVRLSSFMSILLTGMVVVTLWITYTPSRPVPKATFGPFIVTWEQVCVGVIANLAAVPLHILIVQLLKRSKQIRFSALKYMVDLPTENTTNDQPDESLSVDSGHQEGGKLWPWWCRILGYVLLGATICGSALLIILFGMQFADEKARRWLSSSVVCFLSSFLGTQPLEIIIVHSGLEFVEKLCCPVRKAEESEGTPIHQPSHPIMKFADRVKISMSKRAMTVGFLIIVSWMAYNERTLDSYRVKSNLEKMFVTKDFDKVMTAAQVWRWLDERYLPALRNQWYNGRRPTDDLKGVLSDKASRIIGATEMRQVRSRPTWCNTDRSSTITPCPPERGPSTEDRSTYGLGWTVQDKLDVRREEYEYRESLGLATIGRLDTYSPNGYTVSLSPYPLHETSPETRNFSMELAKLRTDGWLDRRTRAIIVDLCVYNFQTDIYASMQFVFEAVINGDTFVATYDIRPSKFTSREAEKACFYVHWTGESIFIICVVFYIFRQLYNILNEGLEQYFTDPWTPIESIIICSSIAAIVYYFLRLDAADSFFAQLKDNYDTPEICHRLRYLARLDRSLTICIALVVFGATSKLIHVFSWTSTVGVAARRMATRMGWFAAMLLVFYGAFFAFFYLAVYNGENATVDDGDLIEFAIGMIVGRGRMKRVFGESTMAAWFGLAFAFLNLFVFSKLASSIVLNAYTSSRESNLAEGTNVLTIFEHVISKVSRTFIGGSVSNRILNLKRENEEQKNLRFLNQRMEDLSNRMDQIHFEERGNAAFMNLILEHTKKGSVWEDEVMEIDIGEAVGRISEGNPGGGRGEEGAWVIEQDNMYRLEE